MFRILKYLPKKLYFLIIMTIILSILQPFVLLTIPSLIRQFIEMVSNNQIQEITLYDLKISSDNINPIAMLCILLTTFSLLFSLILFVTVRLASYLTVNASHHLRKLLFSKILQLSRSDLDKISYATIITRFSNDIVKIREGLFIMVRILWRSPFMVIWGLALSFYFSLFQSISIAITIPFLIAGAIFAIKKLFPLYRKENWKIDNLNEISKQDINGIMLIKSYNLEKRQLKNYVKKNIELRENNYKSGKIGAISWPIINSFVNVGTILLFVIVALLIRNLSSDKIGNEIGTLYQFTSYLTLIANGVFETSFNVNGLFRSKAAALRYHELIDYESTIKQVVSENKIKIGNIKFENVFFRYDEKNKNHSLNNVSFEIPANTTFGIIGKTGSGKSTIAKLVTREYLPNSGKIKIDNIDVNEIDTKNFYSNISHVYQKPTLLSGSIKNNLLFSEPTKNDLKIEEAIKMSCSNFVYEFENSIEQIIGQKGINLSGGQKQRLAIARSLIKKPKILILDDATSALDNITDEQVRENIKNNLGDTTVIIISQRISSIKNSNQIMILNEGQIVGIGKHNELLKNNKYYQDIYNSQLEGNDEKE